LVCDTFLRSPKLTSLARNGTVSNKPHLRAGCYLSPSSSEKLLLPVPPSETVTSVASMSGYIVFPHSRCLHASIASAQAKITVFS
jgi:hypothetical protein